MENNSSAIFENLNPAQDAAVRCVEGPVLIVAGAGSGKTRVLTSRIAYMISKGVDPSRILALTFTKKAAQEMKDRIAAMVGDRNARRIVMGTFHSVFIRFLRTYSSSLDFPASFTIYDTSDSQSMIKTILKEKNIDEKAYKPKDVLSTISMAKNNLVLPGAYANNKECQERDTRRKMPRMAEIYQEYMVRCHKAGVMDFDDILLYMNILMRDNKQAVEDLGHRFGFILVDEYQDTNRSQYLILKHLAQFHRNLCVVGDDSQSIYAFRGAQVANILNFSKDYPDYHLFRLEQNYRSTQVIVDAANSLIEHNQNRIKKVCFSNADAGEKIRIIDGYTPDEEGRLIASSIKGRISADGAQYSDFAILYRTNSQSRSLEQELRRANIPYQIFSGKSFFERAEVKDMMAYFKLLVNNNDDESFRRVVNKPARGIGETSLIAIVAAAAEAGSSLFAAAAGDTLSRFGLRQGAIDKIHLFCNTIKAFSARAAKEDAYDVAKGIAYESGLYQSYKQDTSVEGQAKLANLDELMNNVKEVVEEKHSTDFEELQAQSEDPNLEITEADLPTVLLGDYLENISLLSSVDMGEDEEDGSNKVAMMTVHSAKGLEFPYVYVSGMEEDLFPSGGIYATPADLEEERRLFYVALTRAKKVVTLTMSKTRMKEGRTDMHAPSRFLRDIDPRFMLNPLPDVKSAHGLLDDDDFGDFDDDFRPRQRTGYGQPRQYPSHPARPAHTAQQPQRTSGITAVHVVKPQVRTVVADFVPSPIGSFKAGQRVEHNRFGLGVIKAITGDATDPKAVVQFDSFGEKQLILKYAKMRIV